MFVIVTGSRHAQPANKAHTRVIWHALVNIHRTTAGPHVLYHGAAKGADIIAAAYAKHLGWSVIAHPARWSDPCRDTCTPGHRREWMRGQWGCPAAGVYRNQEMVAAALAAAWVDEDAAWQDEDERAELHNVVCLAFPLPGSKGTHDCAQRARDAGIRVDVHHLPAPTQATPQQTAGAGPQAEPAGR